MAKEENQRILFHSVLLRYVESFGTKVIDMFRRAKGGGENVDKLFDFFPERYAGYLDAIQTIVSISECNPELMIEELVQICEDLCSRIPGTLFTTMEHMYMNSEDNEMIIPEFGLFFVADLLSEILAKYHVTRSAQRLVQCGFELCNVNLNSRVLDQWSVVISKVSENNYTEIVNNLPRKMTERVFRLLQFTRLDKNIDNQSLLLKECAKFLHTELSIDPEIWYSLASLLESSSVFCDEMNEIFEIAWSYKGSSADSVLTVLYPLLNPEQQQLAQGFLHADRTNTKPSLIAFHKLMRRLEREKQKSKLVKQVMNAETCSDAFMMYFFDADFACCPEIFRDVLVHLAVSEFPDMMNKVFSKLLETGNRDPRFLVALMTIPVLNSQEISRKEMNELVKEKYISCISEISDDVLADHGVMLSDADVLGHRWITDADRRVEKKITEWGLSGFEEIPASLRETTKSHEILSLEVQFVMSFRYLIPLVECDNEKFMLLLLQFSFNRYHLVAETAYEICVEIIKNKEMKVHFINYILEFCGRSVSNEAIYVCAALLLEAVKHNGSDIPQNVLYDTEYFGITCISSICPRVRCLGLLLMEEVASALGNRGFWSFVAPNKLKLEETVKMRAIARLVRSTSEIAPPRNRIKLENALCSCNFSIWLLFIEELANVMAAVNYLPLIMRLVSMNTSSDTPVGIMIFQLASCFDPTTINTVRLNYGPFFSRSRNPKTKSENIAKMLTEMLHNKDQAKTAFTLIEHCHITLYPVVLDALSLINRDDIPEATRVLMILLKSPDMTRQYAREIISNVVQFTALAREFLASVGANGPRVMTWTRERERIALEYIETAKVYCVVISTFMEQMNSQAPEEDWPLSSREIVFRFLMNWSSTTIPELESLRIYTAEAIASVIRIGPLFSDSLLFTDDSLDIFARIEMKWKPVLSFLLYFHVDLLLDHFIDACFKQPIDSAGLFFEAIIAVIEPEYIESLCERAGELLLLGLVYRMNGHHRANDFLTAVIDVIRSGASTCDVTSASFIETLVKDFKYATEAIFDFGFRVLGMEKLPIRRKDIIESMGHFAPVIRLLPKHNTCIPSVKGGFTFFTPYSFLERLMEVTEALKYEDFAPMIGLWSKLIQSPDHCELIPLFLMNWKNPGLKQEMFLHLITSDAPNIVTRLAPHCSFAYYYHVTHSLSESFAPETWVVPLITTAFQQDNEELTPHVATVIHFAFLWADTVTTDLLQVLCHRFGVDVGSGPLSIDMIIPVAAQMVKKLGEKDEQYLDYWGTEALKWLLGCQSLSAATLSLAIYNLILRPVEPLVVTGICKAVTFHIINSANDIGSVARLVHESFIFYCSVFEGNENFAFDYSSAFLDCRAFVESSLASASHLFLKCLNTPTTSMKAWKCIIGIIRPLLPLIETDEHAQHVFDFLISKSNSEELMMIVAPVKHCHSELFTSVPPFTTLINGVSETTMCKSLGHYSSMIDTASNTLLNSIYELSSQIIQKFVNENIWTPLAKIYNSAVKNLSVCPGAVDFICTIAKYEPSVATKSVYKFYEWDRSLEDVCRSLGRLIDSDEGKFVTLTDCSTVQSVYNLLNCDVVPRILPFAAQQEMIEGMKVKTVSKRRYATRRKSLAIMSSQMLVPPLSPGVRRMSRTGIRFDYAPLTTPKKIPSNEAMFTVMRESDLVISSSEFLNFL